MLLLVIIAGLSWLTLARNDVYADPLALFNDAARKSPAKGRVYFNIGTYIYQYHDDRMDEAITALQRATDLRPDHFRSHFSLGMAYVRRGRLDDAERSFRTALGLKPRSVDALLNLGSVYYLQHKLPEALQAYQDALQAQPGNIDARMNLAKTYRQMGRSLDARREFEMVLQIQPSNAEAAAELRDLGGSDRKLHR